MFKLQRNCITNWKRCIHTSFQILSGWNVSDSLQNVVTACETNSVRQVNPPGHTNQNSFLLLLACLTAQTDNGRSGVPVRDVVLSLLAGFIVTTERSQEVRQPIGDIQRWFCHVDCPASAGWGWGKCRNYKHVALFEAHVPVVKMKPVLIHSALFTDSKHWFT